ncbi:hypothetical protein SDC9_44027 [bioreactor metagenome]|uniref:Radical SAM core domain-containing protein n=1 Tax=bioreactor metagenome TaxID=1076179 RepID=A0A644W559_9ZZZZ
MALDEKPIYPRGYMILTLRCNLKCRMCNYMVPYLHDPWHPSLVELTDAFDKLLQIADYETFDFSGGEIFLRKDLAEFLRFVHRYIDNIKNSISIVTNCTIPLEDDLLDSILCFGNKIRVILDNYGDLSPHFQDIHDRLFAKGIRIDVHNYTGESQYCGGWTDRCFNPDINDTRNKDFECLGGASPHIPYLAGKVGFCAPSILLKMLYGIDYQESNFFNLNDEELTLEQKREKCGRILLQKQCAACKHHTPLNGEDKQRFSAAEQLTKEEIELIRKRKLEPDEIYAMTRKGIK